MEAFKKGLLRVLGILTLFIAIAWYGDLDRIREDKTTYDKEYNISYSTAKDRLVHPVYTTHSYHYQKVQIVNYTRTMIPFKYTEGTTINTKQYYSRGAN